MNYQGGSKGGGPSLDNSPIIRLPRPQRQYESVLVSENMKELIALKLRNSSSVNQAQVPAFLQQVKLDNLSEVDLNSLDEH